MSQLPFPTQSKAPTNATISKTATNNIRKRIFLKELRTMMYGFGDVSTPRQDTVETVEDCLLDFLSRFVSKSFKVIIFLVNTGFKTIKTSWREGSNRRYADGA